MGLALFLGYLMPLRAMVYDAGEYENQVARFRKKIRKQKGISRAEFLSGFGRECRLLPCITLVLYYGNNWDGGQTLHSILDFTDIPEPLRKMVGDYHINLLDIKQLRDTSVYKTDLKQVFDFIRFSEDKEKLWKLVENDSSYQQMDEDAYDVAISFTKSEKLIDKQQFTEGGRVNMCRALVELKEEGIQTGIQTGIREGIQGAVAIMRELNLPLDMIAEKVKKQYDLTDEQTKEYLGEEK